MYIHICIIHNVKLLYDTDILLLTVEHATSVHIYRLGTEYGVDGVEDKLYSKTSPDNNNKANYVAFYRVENSENPLQILRCMYVNFAGRFCQQRQKYYCVTSTHLSWTTDTQRKISSFDRVPPINPVK